MAITHINKGAAANDHTGTSLRDAAQIINDNFDYVQSDEGAGDLINAATVENTLGIDDAFSFRDSVTGLLRKVAWSNLVAAIKSAMSLTKSDVGLGNADNTSDANKPVSTAVQNALNSKLDSADYVQHFKGVYVSLVALQTALPTANEGDYAQVDSGTGGTFETYAYDVQDGWVLSNSQGSGAANTDDLPEGSTNLYFTASRAINALTTTLAGYARLASNNVWTAAQRNTPVTLTSVSNSITINLNQSNNYNHVLTENTTLANPTNAVEGQAGNVFITQDSDTAKTLAFDTNWKKAKGSATAIPTTLDAKCSIEYRVLAADYVLYSIVVEDGVV